VGGLFENQSASLAWGVVEAVACERRMESGDMGLNLSLTGFYVSRFENYSRVRPLLPIRGSVCIFRRAERYI
jgi:hypothetical protein